MILVFVGLVKNIKIAVENKKVRAFLFLLCYNRKLIGDNMEKIEVKEIRDNKLSKAKVKVNEFVASKK